MDGRTCDRLRGGRRRAHLLPLAHCGDKYLSYGSEDAALWRLVAVEGNASDEAEQADGHGGGRDPKSDVHPGAGLHPDEHGERHQLAHAEAQVGCIEVARQPAGGVAAAAPPELVGPVRDDVRLEAAAA
uniref:Uncharacterized protein n=1 Tax=Zea mays TaxID=4577 RepID=C4J098_MAIZE|nr:unknown [Zea mays]